jgi:hypothetical protein
MGISSRIAIAVSTAVLVSGFSSPALARHRIRIHRPHIHLNCWECKRFERGTLRPAFKDTEREVRNFGNNTEEAVRESGRLVRNQGEMMDDVGGAYLKSVAHDGNFLRAGYEMQRDYINGTEANTVNLLQQSSEMRTGAQILAGAAYGPFGTAGFNYLYVKKTTHDEKAARKTAVVTGVASYLVGKTATAPNATAGEIATSAAEAGAVNGAASEQLGGKFSDGFRNGAVASVAASAYTNTAGRPPESGPARGEPYEKNGEDVRLLDPNRPHTGTANPNPLPADEFLAQHWSDFSTEHSPWMQGLSRVPGVNPGSFLHDIWTADHGVTEFPWLQLSIPPAFALTYLSIGTQRNDQLLESAVENRDK